MKGTKIYYKKTKMKSPIMIVGLPGIGNVGSLVCEHVRDSLGAKRFATLNSPHFLHQTIMLKNGGMRLINNRFYYKENKKNTIVILLGDTQAGTPEGQYDVNEMIVKFFKSLGGKRIYTIGGYNAGGQFVHNPRVFGVATNKALRKELKSKGVIFGKAAGTIWGSAGLIPAFARKNGLEGACLMGETAMLEIDATAAKAVLDVLKKLLGIEISLDNIDKIKKETERLIKEVEDAQKAHEFPPQSKENLTYIR
ncbi:MAG: proteasome assembly chaperone family protein [Candidatus Micrarchaeota archaeon]|nr:proteasome assembly chaperone family protein [Candidatus Micrarchaeota archaeon]MDE1850116.1 proteasome assembly chaperone family protein [Candidatus Micrarchaeota archaeon]MDE1851495.1 proteasome assembly chaperone family protein [Candidatus Micrarchaeota archaeon]